MKTRTILKLLGTKKDHREEVSVAMSMLVVTLLYVALSNYLMPTYAFNIYEFTGTWTGLVCVWLSRTKNILCWPWGIVSSLLLGVFFHHIGLPGQQWLNWGYFVLIQLWAWPHWVFGGAHDDELPVSTLSLRERVGTVIAVVLGTIGVYFLIDILVPGSHYPLLDSLVVSSSIVAQYLLGRKKVESWLLWLGPVNLLSIVLFYLTSAYTLTVLYVAFFIHALFAFRAWAKTK